MSVLYPLTYGTGTIGWQNTALDRTSILFIKFQFYCDRFAALQNWAILSFRYNCLYLHNVLLSMPPENIKKPLHDLFILIGISETYSESCLTSKMSRFEKIVNDLNSKLFSQNAQS